MLNIFYEQSKLISNDDFVLKFQTANSRDLVIDFDVQDLISDLERLSEARKDNFINALQQFLYKYQGNLRIIYINMPIAIVKDSIYPKN